VRRAYSLATLPEDGRVELWVERHPGGAAGPWLLDLPVGAELDLSPPRGGFGLLPSPGPEAIFAGEVTGAVPLVAMARRFTREGTVGRASLLLSIPHPDLDICAAVRRAAPGNVPVESASPADVASRLQTLLHDSRDRLGEAFGSTAALYLAGGGAFLDAAWGVVGAVGLSPTRVRQEKFW
jgi:methane monooxygenase component C